MLDICRAMYSEKSRAFGRGLSNPNRYESDLLQCSAFFLASISHIDFTRSADATSSESTRLLFYVFSKKLVNYSIHVSKRKVLGSLFYYMICVLRTIALERVNIVIRRLNIVADFQTISPEQLIDISTINSLLLFRAPFALQKIPNYRVKFEM